MHYMAKCIWTPWVTILCFHLCGSSFGEAFFCFNMTIPPCTKPGPSRNGFLWDEQEGRLSARFHYHPTSMLDITKCCCIVLQPGSKMSWKVDREQINVHGLEWHVQQTNMVVMVMRPHTFGHSVLCNHSIPGLSLAWGRKVQFFWQLIR